jgi:hypothetical protein
MLRVRGVGEVEHDPNTLWVDASASARLGWLPSRSTVVTFDLRGIVPLQRYRYLYAQPDGTRDELFRSSPVGVAVGAGLGWRWN